MRKRLRYKGHLVYFRYPLEMKSTILLSIAHLYQEIDELLLNYGKRHREETRSV